MTTLWTRGCGLLLAATVLSACTTLERQPRISHGGIEPSQLTPGDTAVISVEIRDQFDIVDRVVGVVKEDETIVFTLKDDGQPPDAEAGDGIWTLQVDVPFNAPPGSFVLDITAYNSDGEPILVRTEDGSVKPLGASYPLEIRFATAPQEP